MMKHRLSPTNIHKYFVAFLFMRVTFVMQGGLYMQTISTRFDDDTIKRLDEIAAHTEQPRSALIKNAVGHYLDYLAWYSDTLNVAYDDLETGRGVEHEQVKAKVRELGLHVD